LAPFFSSPDPPAVSKLDRKHTGRQIKRETLLTGEEGGEGKEPNNRKGRKPGPLYHITFTLNGPMERVACFLNNTKGSRQRKLPGGMRDVRLEVQYMFFV
jgi:hypothetical protein